MMKHTYDEIVADNKKIIAFMLHHAVFGLIFRFEQLTLFRQELYFPDVEVGNH